MTATGPSPLPLFDVRTLGRPPRTVGRALPLREARAVAIAHARSVGLTPADACRIVPAAPMPGAPVAVLVR